MLSQATDGEYIRWRGDAANRITVGPLIDAYLVDHSEILNDFLFALHQLKYGLKKTDGSNHSYALSPAAGRSWQRMLPGLETIRPLLANNQMLVLTPDWSRRHTDR